MTYKYEIGHDSFGGWSWAVYKRVTGELMSRGDSETRDEAIAAAKRRIGMILRAQASRGGVRGKRFRKNSVGRCICADCNARRPR